MRSSGLSRPSRTATGADHRILVQHGEHWLRNNGDLAMLGVTIDRLRARWPEARISVLTSSPALLRAYVPGAQPVADGRLPSPLSLERVGRVVSRLGPGTVGPSAVWWLHERERLHASFDRVRRRMRPTYANGVGAVDGDPVQLRKLALRDNELAAVRSSSLVLALGGGYVADVDPGQTTTASRSLATMPSSSPTACVLRC
jgi:hypothetical protein